MITQAVNKPTSTTSFRGKAESKHTRNISKKSSRKQCMTLLWKVKYTGCWQTDSLANNLILHLFFLFQVHLANLRVCLKQHYFVFFWPIEGRTPKHAQYPTNTTVWQTNSCLCMHPAETACTCAGLVWLGWAKSATYSAASLILCAAWCWTGVQGCCCWKQADDNDSQSWGEQQIRTG